MPNGTSPAVTVRDLRPWLFEESPSGREPRLERVRPRFPDGHVVPDSPSGVEIILTSSVPVQQALDLQRRRQEVFVSTLAHELRQPLSAVSAAVAVVRLSPGFRGCEARHGDDPTADRSDEPCDRRPDG